MKKFTYIVFCMALVAILTAAVHKSAGPPGCHAGEPPGNKTCVSCHTDKPLNTGTADVMLDIDGAENGYELDKTYTITVRVSKTGMKAGGFQVIALQDNNINISPGTVSLTDPTRTQTVDRNNPHAHGCTIADKVWIEHRFQGIQSDSAGVSEWKYNWKAPSEAVGNITFYLAAMESDFDLTEDGDYTYTRSVSSPDITTSLDRSAKSIKNLRALLDPARRIVYIQSDLEPITSILLMDMMGKTLQLAQPNQEFNYELSTEELPKGIYLLKVQTKYQTLTTKIMTRYF
jgi:hypothetical protein